MRIARIRGQRGGAGVGRCDPPLARPAVAASAHRKLPSQVPTARYRSPRPAGCWQLLPLVMPEKLPAVTFYLLPSHLAQSSLLFSSALCSLLSALFSFPSSIPLYPSPISYCILFSYHLGQASTLQSFRSRRINNLSGMSPLLHLVLTAFPRLRLFASLASFLDKHGYTRDSSIVGTPSTAR
jgi:hypothetical protein